MLVVGTSRTPARSTGEGTNGRVNEAVDMSTGAQAAGNEPGRDEPGRDDDLRQVAEAVAALHREIGTEKGPNALQRLVERGAVDLVGARWSSVTVLRRGQFQTIVSNEPHAVTIDKIQYELGQGPCVDAVIEDATFVSADIGAEDRWQPLGQRLHDLGVRSMLAYRLHLLDETELVAGLNFSSDRHDAFSVADVHRGLILASHCALLVTAEAASSKAENLLRGLESNREIGVAVGVLMARYRLTRQQAFDVLRVASQNTNRKLVDIAVEVGDTGVAPLDLDGVWRPDHTAGGLEPGHSGNL